MTTLKWNIIHDADGDDGTPSLWSARTNSGLVWIEEDTYGYNIIDTDDNILKTCKTLTSAKRWVATNL